MELTVAELFAGVGGFRVGLNHVESLKADGRADERGAWRFVWANQYEPSMRVQHAFDCYTERFGSAGVSNSDISLIGKRNIPSHSLLVGGFPCQDYSVARSRSGEQGIEGKKGVLFWEIRDVLAAQTTPFVLLENVDRLLKSPAAQRGRDFAIILKTFDTLGYDAQWRVINAGDYGMPQRRRRLFIFAYRRELRFAERVRAGHVDQLEGNVFNEEFGVGRMVNAGRVNLNRYVDAVCVSNSYSEGGFLGAGIMVNGKVYCAEMASQAELPQTLRSVVEAASEPHEERSMRIVDAAELERWAYLKSSKRLERCAKNGHTYVYSEGAMAFPDCLDAPARTLLTSEGSVSRSSHIIYDEELKAHRILTPGECELLQMFPKGWTAGFPVRRRYFLMGNALVTGIIARLEPHLRKIIESED